MTTTTQRIVMISTAAAVLAGASLSAMAWGPGEGCDGPRGGKDGGPRAEKMQQRMHDVQAKRQADLKAKLKLAPEQEAAWAQFTQATQMPMIDPQNRPDPAEMAKLTTPERIDRMQAMKAQRDAHMTQVATATKAFYASLNAEQKAIFDAETARGHQGPGSHKGPRMGQ